MFAIQYSSLNKMRMKKQNTTKATHEGVEPGAAGAATQEQDRGTDALDAIQLLAVFFST